MKPESIKTKNPVFFVDGVPLHRLLMIQDGMGGFIGKTRTSGLLGIPVYSTFAGTTVPKGLTLFSDGSHRYSTFTKGYEFDEKNPSKKPLIANLQLAIDIRVLKKDSKITSNFDMKCLKDGVGLGNGSYTLVGSGVWQVYLVHQYGYPKTGETVKAGNPLSLTIPMADYHLHIYCLKNGKQFDMRTLILEAGVEYDKAEAESKKVPDPCEKIKEENEILNRTIKDKETQVVNLQKLYNEQTTILKGQVDRAVVLVEEKEQEIIDLEVKVQDLESINAVLREKENVKDIDTFTSSTMLERIVARGEGGLIITLGKKLEGDSIKGDVLSLIRELLTKFKNFLRE